MGSSSSEYYPSSRCCIYSSLPLLRHNKIKGSRSRQGNPNSSGIFKPLSSLTSGSLNRHRHTREHIHKTKQKKQEHIRSSKSRQCMTASCGIRQTSQQGPEDVTHSSRTPRSSSPLKMRQTSAARKNNLGAWCRVYKGP